MYALYMTDMHVSCDKIGYPLLNFVRQISHVHLFGYNISRFDLIDFTSAYVTKIRVYGRKMLLEPGLTGALYLKISKIAF